MGIYICLDVSKAVTKDEWESVYNETLQLVEKFPLVEMRNVNIKGINTLCLTKTCEREHIYGWNHEKRRMGWETVGDANRMRMAEAYYVPKDLSEECEMNENAGDAILGVLPSYLDYDWNDDRFSQTYNLWGGKSQGEPYHMYLLAIACLIEDRLKHKAYVHGDITYGQCIKATMIANKYLEKKITLPARCELNRLYERVETLDFSEKEKLEIFICAYLGSEKQKFGEFIREHFSVATFQAYWKDVFAKSRIGTIGFNKNFNNYLLWGGNLNDLCKFVQYHDENGADLYDKFILRVMDAKLHLKEKDCRDIFGVDENRSTPYGVWTQLAQFAFAGARNKKVDRYIPIEELRRILLEEFEDKCDVNAIITDYLEKEANNKAIKVNKETDDGGSDETYKIDVSYTLNRMMDMWKEERMDMQEKYDVLEYEDLLFYKKGDTVTPSLDEVIKDYFQFYKGIIEEEMFDELMRSTAHVRCKWLVEQNRNILIRDSDWEKIFDAIENEKDSFERYYSMVRVDACNTETQDLVIAIVLNDDFYEYLLKNTGV